MSNGIRVPKHSGMYFREEFVERNRVYVSRPWDYIGLSYEEYEDFLQGKVYTTDEMLLGLEEIKLEL